MTYAELLQAIRDYTEVDSNVLTDSICNGFIRDAEWRIARDVDADYDRQYANSTLVARAKVYQYAFYLFNYSFYSSD
jgi:hypothetical protein